jgi:energy-coupling factor transporter ATP-binding protein EcfA2
MTEHLSPDSNQNQPNHENFQQHVEGSTVEGSVQGIHGNYNTATIIYNYYYRDEAKTEPVKSVIAPADEKLVCPYRGLFAFSYIHAEYFFGREIFVKELVQATHTRNFITVLGASGSGKSSVVLAGLVPKLQQQGNWKFTHFRPSDGNDPFYALAQALVPLYLSGIDSTDEITQAGKLAETLRNGQPLSDVLGYIHKQHPNHRVLLIVDQFEELYTQVEDETIRRNFLDCLLTIIQSSANKSPPSTVIVATMRVDFLGKALAYPAFAEVLRNADIKIRSMNRDELREVIEKPALKIGVAFQDGLVERILNDVENEPGHLPLLEFALTSLWGQRQGRLLTHTAYEEIGEVRGGLAKYADKKYSELISTDQKQAQHIFIQLVRPGEGTEDTRRIATRTEVGQENWDLVRRLADVRLVVSNSDLETGEDTLEIVHEALIWGWERLREWLNADRNFRNWQEQLRSTMRQWEANNKDDGALLKGALLKEAQSWLQTRPDEVNLIERDFIDRSLKLQKRETAKARRRIQTISTLAVVTLAVGFFGWQQWEQYQFTLNFQAAVDNTFTPSNVDYLRGHLPKFLEKVDKFAEEGKVEQALNNYHQVRIAANNVVKQIKNNPKSFQNISQTEKTFQGISNKSEKSLVSLIIQKQIPLLEENLRKGEFGKRKHPTKKSPIDFENQFNLGAARTTYTILMTKMGVKADTNNNGQVETPGEAEMLPCELLKAINKSWHQYTQERCGWYGSKNTPDDDPIFDAPACQKELNGHTLTDEIFAAPYDYVINRLESCQVIPKQAN